MDNAHICFTWSILTDVFAAIWIITNGQCPHMFYLIHFDWRLCCHMDNNKWTMPTHVLLDPCCLSLQPYRQWQMNNANIGYTWWKLAALHSSWNHQTLANAYYLINVNCRPCSHITNSKQTRPIMNSPDLHWLMFMQSYDQWQTDDAHNAFIWSKLIYVHAVI